MSETLWVSLIGLLAVPISLTIGWFLNRKKNVADIYETISESSHSAMESMQISMEAMQHRLDLAQEQLRFANIKIDSLIEENKRTTHELSQLRQQNMLLLQENHLLHRKMDELTKFVGDTGDIPAVDPVSDPQ